MKRVANQWVSVLAGFALTAATCSAATAAEITWKASIWGPPRAATQPLEWFANEVAAKTAGQMKIEVAHVQGKPTDAVEWIKSGSHDAAWVCPAYFRDKMPLSNVLNLPLLAPDSTASLGRVEVALADHPAIQAELRKWNVKMLIPAPLPQTQLMSTRRISKVDDFQGAKVRVSAEMGKILEEYGATGFHDLSAPESLAALKSGAIDVVALPYPIGFATFKIHEGAKYVTDTISLGASVCYLGVSQKAWDALPAKVQQVMLGLRQGALAQYEGIYARDDAANIAMFKQHGLEFVPFNSADRTRLVAKAIKHWQAWVDEQEKQGLKGREVFEFTQAKIREFNRK